MRLKFAIPMAVAAASLSLTATSRAVVYAEGPADAGDLPATAQVVSGQPVGTSLTSITGTLTLTNGISEADMFEISIASATGFSASTTGFAAGANNFDTQLFLFNSAGMGVAANDDAASGGSQSSLTTGTLVPGLYYLLIDGSGRYPATSTGAPIFPNYTDGTTDPSGTYGPNSPTAIIAGYTGSSNEGGKYSITLTGAQFVPSAPVPEPGTWAGMAAGAAGLAFYRRARRAKAR